jgi:hypothetical protein
MAPGSGDQRLLRISKGGVIMRKCFLLIIICLTGLTQLSCRQQTKITATPESLNQMKKVEVDVFSGRPNPSWIFTKEDEAKLIALIYSLPATDTIKFHEEKLGFRGFIIDGINLNNIDSNTHITVINDIVSVYDADGHRQDLHDKTKSVFNVLQVMSSTHLEPDLYKAIFGN